MAETLKTEMLYDSNIENKYCFVTNMNAAAEKIIDRK